MALYLTNEDVRSLLPMGECVAVMEDLFQQQSRGLVENLPRRRRRYGQSGSTIMGGAVLGSGAHGVRHSNLTLLYSTETGNLDAVLEPGTLAWIRTGAASGVAAKYLSRPESSVIGLIGAGRQAVTQLEAICAVRPVALVKVYARTEETRNRFATEMAQHLGRQHLAAHLVARKRASLEQRHAHAGSGQKVGTGGSGGPRAHNAHVPGGGPEGGRGGAKRRQRHRAAAAALADKLELHEKDERAPHRHRRQHAPRPRLAQRRPAGRHPLAKPRLPQREKEERREFFCGVRLFRRGEMRRAVPWPRSASIAPKT